MDEQHSCNQQEIQFDGRMQISFSFDWIGIIPDSPGPVQANLFLFLGPKYS